MTLYGGLRRGWSMLASSLEQINKMLKGNNGLSYISQLTTSFVVQRTIVAGVVFLASLLLAKILGSDVFGQVAFYMYLIKFFLSGQFGSESGFFRQYYSQGGALEMDAYFTFYSFQLWLVASMVCLASYFIGSVYFFASLGFGLLVPFFSLGPLLRINRMFGFTLLPDIIVSLTTLVGACVWSLLHSDVEGGGKEILLLSVICIIAFYPFVFIMYRRLGVRLSRDIIVNWVLFKSYLKTVQVGIPIFLGTLAFTTLLMVDRLFLEKYHSTQSLSVYMLAFQLVAGAALPISSQNFVSFIDIGERSHDYEALHKMMRLQLRQSMVIGAGVYLSLLALAVGLEKWYLVGYDGLVLLCATLGFGFILFLIAGSVTPIAFYRGRQGLINKLMFVMVGLSVLHNLLVMYMKWPPLWVGYFTAGWLGLFSIFTIILSWNIVKREGR